MRFIHRINSEIDEERSKVVRDLTLAGCVDFFHLADRPELPHLDQNGTGDTIRTDGALALVGLRECRSTGPAGNLADSINARRPHNPFYLILRREILMFRSDFWRANLVHGAYDLSRLMWSSFRHRHGSSNPDTLSNH